MPAPVSSPAPTQLPDNERLLRDALISATVAGPTTTNVAATVNTPGIDLTQAVPFPIGDKITVRLTGSAGNSANNKNLNYVLQHSADNNTSNYVNIPTLGAPVAVHAGVNAAIAASTDLIALPPGTKEFIRAQCTGEANGGFDGSVTIVLDLLF